MKKFLSTCLIILGILIIFFPKIQDIYYNHKQKNILKNMEILDNEKDSTKNSQINKNNSKNNNLIPILQINKINLKQPILIGATQENMKISVTAINDKIKPGEWGNLSICGHRSYTYGRNFNRLNEIDKNDLIKISYKNKEFTYKVIKKFLVKPEDISVLNSNKNKKEITLITCEPMYNPTHRLIIRGELIN